MVGLPASILAPRGSAHLMFEPSLLRAAPCRQIAVPQRLLDTSVMLRYVGPNSPNLPPHPPSSPPILTLPPSLFHLPSYSAFSSHRAKSVRLTSSTEAVDPALKDAVVVTFGAGEAEAVLEACKYGQVGEGAVAFIRIQVRPARAGVNAAGACKPAKKRVSQPTPVPAA